MISASIKGFDLIFETHESCFSPRHIDSGTLAMLSAVEFREGDKILDLGCGYGVVGVVAARFTAPENIYMLDIDKTALEYAGRNIIHNNAGPVNILLSDAYDGLQETGFDYILSNPPYQSDFSTPKKFIEKGFNRLKIGGRFYMVTKRKLWYRNKFLSIFGGVKIHEINGYLVFEAEKRRMHYYKTHR